MTQSQKLTILSIETSCDETGVTILEGSGNTLTVLGNALASQIELHAKYGGVFPALAKRAHAEKIVPLLGEALAQAQLLTSGNTTISETQKIELLELCKHEAEAKLAEQIIAFVETHEIPTIDHIAVTAGPGLEPALWVGINTAIALGKLWNKPVYPINHMEGHIVSALFLEKESETIESGTLRVERKKFEIKKIEVPALALLVSGGHTELVLIEEPLNYKKIGYTKDDAVGEAFDKVARILGLPYPGGPKISALAKEAREQNLPLFAAFPRPMLHSGDYFFSYSGLKTAVLYATKDKSLTDDLKKAVARAFEDAAIEVLVTKTKHAIEEFGVQMLIVGGGVAANTYLREQLTAHINQQILFPARELSTDNSVMIGMVSYYRNHYGTPEIAEHVTANGNRSIEQEIFIK